MFKMENVFARAKGILEHQDRLLEQDDNFVVIPNLDFLSEEAAEVLSDMASLAEQVSVGVPDVKEKFLILAQGLSDMVDSSGYAEVPREAVNLIARHFPDFQKPEIA